MNLLLESNDKKQPFHPHPHKTIFTKHLHFCQKKCVRASFLVWFYKIISKTFFCLLKMFVGGGGVMGMLELRQAPTARKCCQHQSSGREVVNQPYKLLKLRCRISRLHSPVTTLCELDQRPCYRAPCTVDRRSGTATGIGTAAGPGANSGNQTVHQRILFVQCLAGGIDVHIGMYTGVCSN